MKKSCLLGAVCSLIVIASLESKSAPVIGSTGNAYEYIAYEDITWVDAEAASSSLSYLGVSGHLVSISDQTENIIVLTLLTNVNGSAWLGGSDAAIEGVWEWLDGKQFWQGGIDGTAGPDSTYTNWVSGFEPSNTNGAENYLSMFGLQVPSGSNSGPGLWNDLKNNQTSTGATFSVRGYVVEYELSAVPIPPALWLFGSGMLGLIGIARRKKAASWSSQCD